MIFDLRSDTVTKPTLEMRRAMAEAEVGDDVYGEDPTTLALQERVAVLLGKEAALFVSSGTMANQLAIATQTRRGDEVIVGEGAHPIWYESGGAAALSGVQFQVAGTGGFYEPEDIDANVKPRAYYSPRTSLIALENTHNRAGGRVLSALKANAIAERARSLGLRAHLDGARLWNAAVALGESESELARSFDTVSVCFSKGLGAPIGSALVGDRVVIEEAHRLRKMWGGGMRQTGVLAAAALHALEHHRKRLAEDHAAGKMLSSLLKSAKGLKARDPETNIVNIDVEADADKVVALAKDRGLLVGVSGPRRIRAVLHLDIAKESVPRCAEILAEAVSAASKAL